MYVEVYGTTQDHGTGPGADEFSGAAILELQSLIERLGQYIDGGNVSP